MISLLPMETSSKRILLSDGLLLLLLLTLPPIPNAFASANKYVLTGENKITVATLSPAGFKWFLLAMFDDEFDEDDDEESRVRDGVGCFCRALSSDHCRMFGRRSLLSNPKRIAKGYSEIDT